jgi:hypothetical protein
MTTYKILVTSQSLGDLTVTITEKNWPAARYEAERAHAKHYGRKRRTDQVATLISDEPSK